MCFRHRCSSVPQVFSLFASSMLLAHVCFPDRSILARSSTPTNPPRSTFVSSTPPPAEPNTLLPLTAKKGLFHTDCSTSFIFQPYFQLQWWIHDAVTVTVYWPHMWSASSCLSATINTSLIVGMVHATS